MHNKVIAVLGIAALTVTLLLVALEDSESYAQNNTIATGNESDSTTNDTSEWSNQTDAGSISGLSIRGP